MTVTTTMTVTMTVDGPQAITHKLLYTDGACRGNPGVGGWAFLVQNNPYNLGSGWSIYGSEPETTNNRMEITAVIQGLRSLSNRMGNGVRATVITDSLYVVQGITEWVGRWKNNGWRSYQGRPVKNQDLWMELDRWDYKHDVVYEWVRGHSGDEYNDNVDYWANRAINEFIRDNY
ncbi:hypothetical protein SAMD00019534_040190 [Acytostelium subglobosum LB1]|uniref:hypothetical protein n=1 Tax=Acytostelium subglobosum LB1 TaxID=1410327 RepID=UPI000644ADC7|nr:hypothetical protein SAMD00019534_040190 [Acytostelium subglobosum LB1]GAM20844.1 hypothetical protein SAMD00019534_040190 [Acytostelium subglobosum LB1]|eukprot:XP_012755978.1 hypothetical protein SAMD00019534_040190 [Acytostelium subglobosum LB1]